MVQKAQRVSGRNVMKPLARPVAGFTLPELLVVLAVAGILAAIAIPSFQSLTQSQQIKNASFELYSSLVLARSEAIKRSGNVTITGVAYANNESGWVITSAGGEVIRTQGALKGIVLTVLPAGTTGVTFNRSGRATASPTFQIDSSATPTSNVRCIRIELSGMPRTLKGVCS